MKRLILAAAFALLATSTHAADPSDVTVGRPADIPQELFAQVRTACAYRWQDDFEMRLWCEKKQFEAIRKLTGTSK